jgi:hypothetical protein
MSMCAYEMYFSLLHELLDANANVLCLQASDIYMYIYIA